MKKLFCLIFIYNVGCNNPNEKFQIYTWNVVYNIEYLLDSNFVPYFSRIEVDTVYQNKELDSLNKRYFTYKMSRIISKLYNETKILNKEEAVVLIDSSFYPRKEYELEPFIYDTRDTLYFINDGLVTYYFHPRYGVIKIRFTHSRMEGKVKSNELYVYKKGLDSINFVSLQLKISEITKQKRKLLIPDTSDYEWH